MELDSEIGCIVKHSTDSFICKLTMKSTIVELKSLVCARWMFLSHNSFRFQYYDRGGYDMLVDNDLKLRSVVSLCLVQRYDSLEFVVSSFHESNFNAPSFPQSSNPESYLPQPSMAGLLLSSEDSNEQSVITLPTVESSCDRAFNGKVVVSKPTKADAWATIITGVGQDFFGGREEARLVVEKYNHYFGRKVKVVKSSLTRYTVECFYKELQKCNWKFHASSKSTGLKNHFVLRIYNGDHTCCAGYRDDSKNASITRALVKDLVLEQVKQNLNKKPRDIVSDFKSDYGLTLTYDQAHAGKDECLKEIHGHDYKSYSELIWFVDAVKKTNVGSVADLVLEEGTDRFKSVFLAFEASIFGFQFCRPVLFLDGTFLTGKFRGCLMAATGKDANNGIFPLAYGIVSGENVDNWRWFLIKLRNILSDRPLTFISDRHDGLVFGIPEVFPLSKHVFCYYHLKNNVRMLIKKKKEEYAQAMELFSQCFYSATFEGFRQGMDKLKNLGCVGLHKYLDDLPVEKWSTAHCQGCRFGDMCSNVAESFNSWIRDEKSLPIGSLVNRIRLKIMELMNDRRLKGLNKYKGFICPKLEKRVERLNREGSGFRIVKSGDYVFEVLSDVSHVVDITKLHCSCREWYTNQFPCAHAIVCILSINRSVYDFINPYFSITYFQATYSKSIKPIPNEDKPVAVAGEELIQPPEVSGLKVGRPKKKRIPNTGSRFIRPVKCGNCGQKTRHNKTTCTNSPAKKQCLLPPH